MVSTQPAADPAGLYKSGEACKLLGIGSSTLHRYRVAGRIKSVHRPHSSENLYRGRDIINLWRIVY